MSGRTYVSALYHVHGVLMSPTPSPTANIVVGNRADTQVCPYDGNIPSTPF